MKLTKDGDGPLTEAQLAQVTAALGDLRGPLQEYLKRFGREDPTFMDRLDRYCQQMGLAVQRAIADAKLQPIITELCLAQVAVSMLAAAVQPNADVLVTTLFHCVASATGGSVRGEAVRMHNDANGDGICDDCGEACAKGEGCGQHSGGSLDLDTGAFVLPAKPGLVH